MDDQPPEDATADEQSPDDVFVTAVVFEIALGLIALALGWGLGPDPRELIPKFDPETVWPVVSGVMWGLIAAIPILIFIEVVRRIPCGPVRELERLSDDGMMKSLLSLRPLEMVAISLCAGIGEELLFRGWLMYWLADTYTAISLHAGLTAKSDFGASMATSTAAMAVALVVSSIAFGMVHPITKLYIALAAIMGLYFGALAIWTGNLLVPITAHAAYDAAQMLMTARADRKAAAQTDVS